MKANLKSMIVIFIVYFILAFQGNFDVTFLVPLIGIMLFISTFSYDEFNNWNSYAVTLPNGRKNVVMAKYIASIILTAVLGVICVVASMGINYSKTSSINIEELVSSLIGIVLSSSIIISLFYPIMFKFGATNGRIILFMVVFGIAGIVALIGNIVDMTSIVNAMNRLDNYSFMSVPIICVILLVLSYLISDKIYTNKEF